MGRGGGQWRWETRGGGRWREECVCVGCAPRGHANRRGLWWGGARKRTGGEEEGGRESSALLGGGGSIVVFEGIAKSDQREERSEEEEEEEEEEGLEKGSPGGGGGRTEVRYKAQQGGIKGPCSSAGAARVCSSGINASTPKGAAAKSIWVEGKAWGSLGGGSLGWRT